MDLAPSSMRQRSLWSSLLVLLSWASPALSLPPFDPSASTPGRCCHLPSVCRLHPLHIPFRPRGFSPPRRFAPLWAPGMLHPGADRVRCVSRPHPRAPASETRRPGSSRHERWLGHERVVTAVPRNAVRTLRSIPLVSSRTASLRPLPSCRCRPPHPSGRTGVRPSLTQIVTPTPR
jgi:hypothetical protein